MSLETPLDINLISIDISGDQGLKGKTLTLYSLDFFQAILDLDPSCSRNHPGPENYNFIINAVGTLLTLLAKKGSGSPQMSLSFFSKLFPHFILTRAVLSRVIPDWLGLIQI